MRTAEQIRAAAEAAQQRYKDEESKLYRSDGTKTYSEQEHADRLREIRRERNNTLNDLAKEAASARLEAEREAENIRSEDLSSRLTADELANANARHVFIAEDIAETPAREINPRVESVLASGDRASMYCHVRALRKRAAGNDSPSPGLESAAKRLENELFGESRQQDIERAEERAKEFVGAEMLAGTLRQGARTPAAAWTAGLAGRRAG